MSASALVRVFNDALSLDPAQRSAFLDRACAGDARLLAEVVSLLAVHAASADLPASGPEDVHLEPGTRLGVYTVVREVGRGGMGIVYLATDSRLDRRVALKTLPFAIDEAGSHMGRLTHEARVLASLEHPHIATLHALDEAEGISYIVMEYVDGRPLSEILRVGPVPARKALDLAAQIASAMAYAHERGVVHRDLKPSNVMVTPDDRVKLVDFGLAKVLLESESGAEPQASAAGTGQQAGTLALPGLLIGTPGYMSPEQLRGDPIDHRTDLWSLGCLLHECVTGHAAFPGDAAGARIAATLTGKPAGPGYPAVLPPRVRGMIAKCLDPDPARRPASAREVLAALEQPRNPWALRTRRARGFAALVLAAAIGVGVWITPRLGGRHPLNPTLTQISRSGDVDQISLSRDGRWLGYRTRLGHLVIRDLASGVDADTLVPGLTGLDWNPAGDALVLVRSPYPGADASVTLVAPRSGGAWKQVGPTGFSGQSWSPDGRVIAGIFDRGIAPTRAAILDLATGALRLPDPADSIPEVVGVRWSPAAGWLIGWDRAAGLWRLDPSLESAVPLPPAGWFVNWGPGGRSLYFTPKVWPRESIHRLAFDPRAGRTRGGLRPILEVKEVQQLAIAASGRRIAVTRSFRYQRLWRLDLLGGSTQWEARGSGAHACSSPRVSPDGTRLASIEGTAENPDLVISDLAGSERRVIGRANLDINPAWSPDGARLAFVPNEADLPLRVTRLIDGTEWTTQARVAKASGLAWIAGRGILYQPAEEVYRNLRLLDSETGEETEVFADPGSGTVFQFRPSPDGRRIAVAGSRGGLEDVRTWIVDLNSHAETLLWDRWSGPVGWSRDGDAVYVITASDNDPGGASRSLYRVPLTGGAAIKITDFPGEIGLWRDVDVSADERTVVCVTQEGQSNVWLADGLDLE